MYCMSVRVNNDRPNRDNLPNIIFIKYIKFVIIHWHFDACAIFKVLLFLLCHVVFF